jgi:hypothetical protein
MSPCSIRPAFGRSGLDLEAFAALLEAAGPDARGAILPMGPETIAYLRRASSSS